MKKKKADVIILAAGLSSRFPGSKPLFKLNNKTIIENIIDNLSGICYNIIVVCGYKANEMKTVLNKYGNVQTVVNKNYSDGMFSSILAGIKYVKADSFFVIPSDMPLVKKETYNTLLETEGDIIIPSYNGKKGHPVLMNSKFIPELLVKKSNSNFSDFIKKKGFNLVEVNDAGILIDIDTEEDLKNINSLNL
jgi:molybdenum cofactor cytidylyltransferase